MKKTYVLVISALLISLFIYVFYRTEKTVVTELFIEIAKIDLYLSWQKDILSFLPLNEIIIYSLPEGLWVFCVTLTSKELFLNFRHRQFDLIFLPLLFAIGLELFQLFHFTNGRFDFWDIGFSVFFWAVARYFIKQDQPRQNIFQPFAVRSLTCVGCYLIVYLAHVWE
jgi:hypothetical protein